MNHVLCTIKQLAAFSLPPRNLVNITELHMFFGAESKLSDRDIEHSAVSLKRQAQSSKQPRNAAAA